MSYALCRVCRVLGIARVKGGLRIPCALGYRAAHARVKGRGCAWGKEKKRAQGDRRAHAHVKGRGRT